MTGIDLSGDWQGLYSYPAALPPNRFTASIRDSGGLISGVIHEPGSFESEGRVQHSVIEGRRNGSQLQFIKIYDDLEMPTLRYEGVVQPCGDEIRGEWVIAGDWSGTFLMIRAGKAGAKARSSIGERVPV